MVWPSLGSRPAKEQNRMVMKVVIIRTFLSVFYACKNLIFMQSCSKRISLSVSLCYSVTLVVIVGVVSRVVSRISVNG